MLTKSNFLKYLNENKKIGGVIGFVSNEDYVLKGLTSDADFLKFMFHYVSSNLNHFYYYFLAEFEKKIHTTVINDPNFNLGEFLILIHKELHNVYFKNVYGFEKELWKTNGKSFDKTVERVFKNYDPKYLVYLKEKGYGQLAELCFDIYLYYSFLGDSMVEYNNFMNTYKNFLENEWQPMEFMDMTRPRMWSYEQSFKAEPIHSISQTKI